MLLRQLIFAVLALGATDPVLALARQCERVAMPETMPDQATCMTRSGIELALDASPSSKIEALVDAAKDDLRQARLDEAEAKLDCAAAVFSGAHAEVPLRGLVRARGSLAYARQQMPEALTFLECSLALSSKGDDRLAEASDLNAVGSTLRRLGDYRGALRMLSRSLDVQRAAGKPGGAVLNNIGDVYRDLGEPDEALDHYDDARQVFLDDGDREHAAHVLESMAVVMLEKGDARQAATWLEETLATYREHGRFDYVVRVSGWLIRAALAGGDVAAAQRWKAEGLATATEHQLRLPASFQLQAARTERVAGAPAAAVERLQSTLSDLPASDAEKAGLFEELAAAQEILGDKTAALASLRRARVEENAFDRARYDRQLGWLRTRFETAERDRTIEALETDNRLRRAELRQRNLMLGLTMALAVVLLLLVWLVLQRRRQRERLVQAARLARKEEALTRYRREADTLAEDRQLLQNLLDAQDGATCLLDPDGQLLATSRAANELLGAGKAGAVGRAAAEFLAAADVAALASAIEGMEDSNTQELATTRADGEPLYLRLSQWPHGDGLIVMALSRKAVVSADPAATASDALSIEGSEADMREAFRRLLVELMLSAIDIWERSSGSGRLELAEKSRIWRVAVDDGRLRARSMERYLSVARLPKNPRWRDVLRTAYYVLENCSMDGDTQSELQGHVDAVLAYTRRSALF
ncbi:MAG: tetratricopeptide repeat protein [Xanthomonadales bacterium]|nr:tetratricopeptide repeat protein [Xanthomonadales bacterium]